MIQKKFCHLPLFAKFILSERLHDFLSAVRNHPDLEESSLLTGLRADKVRLHERTRVTVIKMLDYFQNHLMETYVADALQRWVDNATKPIDKYAAGTEDIVTTNGICQSAMIGFSSGFTESLEEMTALHLEIVAFFVGFNRRAFQLHDQLSKERIKISADQLLEAHETARVPRLRPNLDTPGVACSPPVLKNLEASLPQSKAHVFQHLGHDEGLPARRALHQAFDDRVFELESGYTFSERVKIQFTRAIIKEEEGNRVMMRGMVKDMTSWEKNEKDLLAKLIKLEESNARLQQFAAIASHDLKEPLRKVQTYFSMIAAGEKDRLGRPSQLYLEKIVQTIGRMNSFIDNLLTYSSLEHNEERQYCNLQEILEEVIDSLEFRLKEKNGIIASDGLPMACVIPFQMQQLFQNLLSNALKFCRESETPVIRLSHTIQESENPLEGKSKKILSIRIADNCLGFSKEHVSKVFNVFYRVHDKAKYGGNGLGLSICQKIVENHGGSISVQSIENEGSTFQIDLPLRE